MTIGENQDVMAFSEPDKVCSQQGGRAEIKALFRLHAGQAIELAISLGHRDATQVRKCEP